MSGDDVGTSRRQRQRGELCALCASGAVARAVDLAFEHFALFGRDAYVIDVLRDAIDHHEVGTRVRRQFAELCAFDRGSRATSA